jgi:hypothetical protein
MFVIHDAQLRIADVFRPAIAGRSAGPESIAPAVVMDSGLAYAALRASHAPRNDECCWWSLRTDMIRTSETLN